MTAKKTEAYNNSIICPPSKWSYDIALTVTLRSSHKRLDAEGQYVLTKEKLLQKLSNCKLTLIAELTSNYDVHYHGILRIPIDKCKNKHPLRYIKDVLRSEFGFTCVKEVDSYAGWVEYLQKDIEETSKVIYPILKDDYDIFDKRLYVDDIEKVSLTLA